MIECHIKHKDEGNNDRNNKEKDYIVCGSL